MGLLELIFIAIGLSLDAFAVSACLGLSMQKAGTKKPLIVGLYFGFFQAVMPLIGYFVGSQFSSVVNGFDHWVVFILLALIGGKMVIESFKNTGCSDRDCPAGTCSDRSCPNGVRPQVEEVSFTHLKLLPLAFATSIDALAVGISFAFIQVTIVPAVCLIGVVTFILSVGGVKIGNAFGAKFKSKAELGGGIILILIGLKTLLEHINA